MAASIDLNKAFKTRIHGDLAVVFTWVNDERSMVLIPHLRKRAPWFVVTESAAYTWDDMDARNVPVVARKAAKACEVLGIEPGPWNCRRVAGLIIDGLEDLIRMPGAPDPEKTKGVYGQMALQANGETVTAEGVRYDVAPGATYG